MKHPEPANQSEVLTYDTLSNSIRPLRFHCLEIRTSFSHLQMNLKHTCLMECSMAKIMIKSSLKMWVHLFKTTLSICHTLKTMSSRSNSLVLSKSTHSRNFNRLSLMIGLSQSWCKMCIITVFVSTCNILTHSNLFRSLLVKETRGISVKKRWTISSRCSIRVIKSLKGLTWLSRSTAKPVTLCRQSWENWTWAILASAYSQSTKT